jgi:hypothetical protein
VGARLTLKAGGSSQIREVAGGNGYSAQSSYRVHFGLGNADRIESLEIRWPNGSVEKVDVPLNRFSYVRQGRGVQPGPQARN